MPGYAKPAGRWLGDRMAASMHDVERLKKQATEYLVNPAQECVLVIGNIETAPIPKYEGEETEKTGLTGWGIAIKVSGKWVSLASLESGGPTNFACTMGTAVQPSPAGASVVTVPVELNAVNAFAQIKMGATKAEAEAATSLSAPQVFTAGATRQIVPITFALPLGWWFLPFLAGAGASVYNNSATYWPK